MAEKLDKKLRLEAAQKILGEPVFVQNNPLAQKVRLQLLLVGALGIVLGVGDLRVDKESSFLGIKFGESLSQTLIGDVLLVILLYLLVHFLVLTWSSFWEWRLRVTGQRELVRPRGWEFDEHDEWAQDPRNATLYNWWRHSSHRIGEAIEQINTVVDRVDEELQGARRESRIGTQNGDATAPKWPEELKKQLTGVSQKLKDNQKAMEGERINASLARFDYWFVLFVRGQNIQWLVFDFVVPIAVGVLAVYQIASWR